MFPPVSKRSETGKWQIGVYCEADQALPPCLEALERCGWTDVVRLFLAPNAVVPPRFGHLPVTCLARELPPCAHDRLAVSEMVMRAPRAAAYLLIRGDSVIARPDCRGKLEALLRRTEDLSLALLEAVESRENGDWFRIADHPRRLPRAVVISNRAAREFLADRGELERASERPGAHSFAAEAIQDWAFENGLPVYAPAEDFLRASETALAEKDAEAAAPIRLHGMDLSVVVPTWNCGPYLRPCLRSLLAQTVDAEVIVVDDASKDETREILGEFADRIQILRHEERRGANAARNTGLRSAAGNLVAMADADNEYSPVWLERLLEGVLSAPGVGLAYCRFSRLLEDGRKGTFASGAWDPSRLWYDNYIDMPALVRREALPADGLVEGFRPFDDWRLWLDMASRGWAGKFVAENLYTKRVRKGGKTLQSKSLPADRARQVARLRREFARLVDLQDPVAVVIPAHACEDLTVRCLRNLSDFSGVPFDVFYVDNGSPVSVLDTVARAAEARGVRLRILRNSANLGFTPAVNQGIEASGDANVLVLNNDCFVGPNCLEILAYEMATRQRVAAIGPVTCDRGGQTLRNHQHRLEAGVGGAVLGFLDDPVAVAAELRQRHKVADRELLAFFCTLLNREALRRFGNLDDRFQSGLGADDEWCLRAGARGWRALLAYGAYAAHLHRSTFRRLEVDRDALQRQSKDVLERVLAENQTDGSE